MLGDSKGVTMSDVSRDQFAVIKIEGMHCHKCEAAIQKALTAKPGVREVEVDFPTGQASVLFDRDSVTVSELMEAVQDAGYHATGFTLGRGHAESTVEHP
jgi:copper chaperone CopZ